MPPSTSIVAPVMKEAFREARKTATWATSSGFAMRPTGCSAESSLPLRYYLGYMAFLLLPVGLFAFYEQIIDVRYQGVFRRMWQLHALLAVAGLVLDLTGVAPLVNTRFVVIALLPVDLFIQQGRTGSILR